MSEKKKVEIMLEKNAEAFNDNVKMLFGSKFEEAVSKSLTLKNKSRELFDNLKEKGTSLRIKDSRKEQPFQKACLFCARINGEYSRKLTNQSQMVARRRDKNTFLYTQSHHTRIPVP